MTHYEFVWDEGYAGSLAQNKVNTLARHGYTVRHVVSHNGKLLFVMGKEGHTAEAIDHLFERSAAEVVAPV